MPLLHLNRAFPLSNDMKTTGVGPGEELWSPEFWSKILVSISLVLLGGVLAG